MGDSRVGHVFISYVREDVEKADRLQDALEAAGVEVWRDTANLFPGDDWRLRIKDAITQEALVFIACFSANSQRKAKSHQNEELVLAIDQIRLRPPERPWFIPVRFSDCDLPRFDLGGGRDLNSLQRVDLIGSDWDKGLSALVAAVLRVLGRTSYIRVGDDVIGHVQSKVKSMLAEPGRRIELDEFVSDLVSDACEKLADRTIFPSTAKELTQGNEGLRYLVDQTMKTWEVIEPVVAALVIGGAWGASEHSRVWRRAVERIARTASSESGQVALMELRWLPLPLMLYGGGLGATLTENYSSLKAIAVDATCAGDRGHVSAIAAAHVWRPFAQVELVPQLLAFQQGGESMSDDLIENLTSRRKGRRHTPISDYLHGLLRTPLAQLIPDETEYTEVFDRLEATLALVATDAERQAPDKGANSYGAWYGSFTWRGKRSPEPMEKLLMSELEEQGESWPPIKAGLFGGSVSRARAAFEIVLEEVATIRRSQLF